MDRLANVTGNFARIGILDSHLTVRRRYRSGDIDEARIVSFSTRCFGKGGILMVSSIMAANADCTLFTGRLRAFKTGILKNFFLNEADCGCGWSV